MQNQNQNRTKETLASWPILSLAILYCIQTARNFLKTAAGGALWDPTYSSRHISDHTSLPKSCMGHRLVPDSAGLTTSEHVLHHISVHCVSLVISMVPPPQGSSFRTDRRHVHFRGSWAGSMPWQQTPEGCLWTNEAQWYAVGHLVPRQMPKDYLIQSAREDISKKGLVKPTLK